MTNFSASINHYRMKIILKISTFFILIIVSSLLDSCKKQCYYCREFSSSSGGGRFRYEENTCSASRVQYLRDHYYYCEER